jgi:alkanesulfonate monooxygenase SsuD/methylene tetrahydromethanopterin reductase-like flavin-dependent oxidoreductase (luciferase family)
VAFAAERIREGAERAGRDPGEIAIAVYVRSWVGEEEAEAWPALLEAAAQYASSPAYARQFQQVGLGAEDPEALVRSVCALGDEARDRIEAYREAGADLPVVYPVATADAAASIESTLSAMAPG